MFWANKDTNDQIMAKKGIDGFKDCVDEVSTVGNWAGYLEIAALATTLDRPILLIHEHGQIYIFNPKGSKPDLYLYYQSCGHCESLQVPKENCLDTSHQSGCWSNYRWPTVTWWYKVLRWQHC